MDEKTLTKAARMQAVVGNAFSMSLSVRQDNAVREFREHFPNMTARDENNVRKAVAEESRKRAEKARTHRRKYVIVKGYVLS